MGKKKRKGREKIDVRETSPATHNPFAAALAGLSAPEADLPELVEESGESAAPVSLPHVTTRIERKGRGGKTVTLVEGLERLTEIERAEVVRDLRKALGTGATDEAGVLVVQGDQRERVVAWFAENS